MTAITIEKGDDKFHALHGLDGALCNFCNGVNDTYEVDKWRAETWNNFHSLCSAYNDAHKAGLMSYELFKDTPIPQRESMQDQVIKSLISEITQEFITNRNLDPSTFHVIQDILKSKLKKEV